MLQLLVICPLALFIVLLSWGYIQHYGVKGEILLHFCFAVAVMRMDT